MKHGFLLPKGIKTHDVEPFGRMIDITTPNDCNLIILCGNNGTGHQPFRCLLPHQIYTKDIKETFVEESYEAIFALPVNSKDTVFIAARDKYSLQRWKR